MPSEVDIVNDALVMLGERPIVSLNDSSDVALTMKTLYPSSRDAVLREHSWRFALWRTQLTQLSGSPPFGYKWAFQLPNDYLALAMPNGFWGETTDDAFTIEAGMLFTDSTHQGVPYAFIRYVRRITDPNKFDVLFIHALSAHLAWDAAIPITGNPTLMTAMRDLFHERLQEARNTDAMEQTPERIYSDELTGIR